MALAATLISVNQRRLQGRLPAMRASRRSAPHFNSALTSTWPSLQPIGFLHLLDQALVDEGQHGLGKGLPHLLIFRATAGSALLGQPALVDEVLEMLGIGPVAHAQHVVIAL